MANASEKETISESDISHDADWNIQSYLQDSQSQLALLNAVLHEGRPELLVGAIWDVAKAMGIGLGARLGGDHRATAGDRGAVEEAGGLA